jgi:non-specific serine/threonine protein kinase
MSGQEPTSFAEVLRRYRSAAGLTQEALAERSGLGIRSIQGLELGETRPRRETMRRLTDALRLSDDDAAMLQRVGESGPRPREAVSAGVGAARRGSGRSPTVHHNLPVQLTSFVGRERELIELRMRLGTARLLTLIGTGGCGKTRLALQVAASAVDAYPDGVWLVELAGLAEPSLVDQAVATVTAVREAAGQPIRATLLVALRARRLLLVLDNCEHLIDACATLADAILRACPDVQILATSREPLGIDGEVAWRVPSLAVASAEGALSHDDLVASEAVHLFADRAMAAQSSFVLSERNAPAVAQICRRLDGIPLAIELGARRVTALSVEQIAARLVQCFGLLTGGSRAVLPRQQTLAATIEWSYLLLSPPERALFDRLAVFAGGFTLDAVEGVGFQDVGVADIFAAERLGFSDADALSSSPETQYPKPDTLEVLARLVDKSLVVADLEAAGTERYRLLETLRQYAHERLEARGELEAIRRRHAAYFLGLATEAGRELLGADQVRWLDRLDRDHDNLHAALSWALELGEAEVGLRMAIGLAYFWYFRGHYSEARTLREAILALPAGPELDAQRAEMLHGVGMLALNQGDFDRARASLDEGLTIARRLGERVLLIPILATLGFVTRVQCEYATARSVLEEGIMLARAAGDTFHSAMAVHHLGLVAFEADRDLTTAWTLNEEALACYGQLGNRRMLGVVRMAMGRIAQARGDVAEARAQVFEALNLHQQVGEPGLIPFMLDVLAGIDADDGQVERAVTVAGAASALGALLGTRIWPVVQREREARLELARQVLGEVRFAQLWAAGQAMPRDRAVAYALGGESPA